ncbi:hypothetical protein HPP92_015531 [Vanilla planifolia]|uniref:Membrane-associated kinase regulator 4 n=1 Tax=Vanilla planifolia TaxID=51239 RepID=A0A835QJD1_VANPL|nr:hypothetical protein HPP92_015531 [Vanilla planifolia]
MMARSFLQYDHLEEEEDFIDMDVSSATTFLCYSISSSPSDSREFEFQMSVNQLQKEPITSPADELFYKGNLLPLHLPPRLQMVEQLLQNSPRKSKTNLGDSFRHISPSHSAATTPFESCSVSPAPSCYASQELNPEDYLECSTVFNPSQTKKSWPKKLRLIRESSFGNKLRASKAYLKSLFTKSACSDDSCTVFKANDCSSAYKKAARRGPFGLIPGRANVALRSFDGEKVEGKVWGHRRSFSDAIKRRHSPNKSSSSSSSSCSSSNSSSFSGIISSNSFQGPQLLTRSSSANSEVENSIQGAIAYCKKTQQKACVKKIGDEAGLCSLSVSRKAEQRIEEQEKPGICTA